MKKLHLFLLLLLMVNLSFAQADLYVSSGSYVYVDGDGFTDGDTAVAPIFVTNDVNLDSNGFIYLRNQAQFLQGNSVGNSGTGQLSVYQTGTSNTYMYNYWGSPVGLNSGVAGNTAFRPSNILYGETVAPITSLPATYVSAPNYDGVAGAPPVIADFWFYSFVGSTPPPNQYADWVQISSTTGNLPSGYGFTMKGNPSGAQQYDFRGRPNNGLITVPINSGRQTLVGNPYPSAIDAREFIHGNANNASILNAATLLFWEQDPASSTSHVLTNYTGGYATYTINASGPVVETFIPATFDTYNPNGTVNTTGGSSTTGKSVYRYIPIGQGFVVESDGTAGNIQFTNAMRIFQKEAATRSEFFRLTSESSEDEAPTSTEAQYTESGLAIMPEGYMRFRLNMDYNDTYTRQLVQTFHDSATDGEDYGLETISTQSHASTAYWPMNGKKFNAQAFAFDEELRIPMVVEVTENEGLNIRFRIFDIQNFEDDQEIFVHDIENNTYVNLRDQDYDIYLESGTYPDRFEITFMDDSETLSDSEVSISDFLVFQDNLKEQLTIKNPNYIEITGVTLYDVAGKLVLNAPNLDTQNVYTFPTKSLSDGVYVTVITVNDSKSVSKKLIIKNN